MKLLFFIIACAAAKLDVKYAWKEIDFSWPSEVIKQEAIRSGKYYAKNNVPLGIEVWKDKVFVTIPRYRTGVASTLNYFKKDNEKSPVLHPYPSWEANDITTDNSLSNKNNFSMISVYRATADECDRLWLVDTGVEDRLGSLKQLAPPTIFIFDLKTDKLIRKFVIPRNQQVEDPNTSYFVNIVVDTNSENCGDAFAYIPGIRSYDLIVYDFKKDKSYRIQNMNYFYTDPLQGNFYYSKEEIDFQWDVGIFGMALGEPLNKQGDRTVYFHAMCSKHEFSVSNTVLKNETLATSEKAYIAFSLLGERGPQSQSTTEFFDNRTGVIFYTLISQDAVGCWNINKPYTGNQGIVDRDHETLFYPNDLKVSRDGILYVLSNRQPVFVYGTLKDDVNFRILSGRTSEIISGTTCETPSNQFSPTNDVDKLIVPYEIYENNYKVRDYNSRGNYRYDVSY